LKEEESLSPNITKPLKTKRLKTKLLVVADEIYSDPDDNFEEDFSDDEEEDADFERRRQKMRPSSLLEDD